MQRKPLLVCDNDDVLQIFGRPLYDFHNKRYNTNYTEKDMQSYDLSISWNCSTQEVFQRIEEYYRSAEHWDARPVEGAVEALTTLAPFLRFAVVTAKPDWLKMLQKAYHDKHFAELIETVEFTNYGSRTKLEVCRVLNPVGVVEDNLDNANLIAGGGIPVYLLNKIWNKGEAHPLVTRFSDWYTLTQHLLLLHQ